MKVVKLVVLSLILITTCVAVENKNTNLQQQLKIQKREKQYLIEDDSVEGPEQKREERQGSSSNKYENDTKVNAKPIKVRLQPKIVQALVNPALKPVVIPKPINIHIDTKPQIIPTSNKIPVIIKTAKNIPNPAHALRMKIFENKKNESALNKEVDINTNKDNIFSPNDRHQLTLSKEDNIPFTVENKVPPKSKIRSSSNQERKAPVNKDDKVSLPSDPKITLNKDSPVTWIQIAKDRTNSQVTKDNKTTSNIAKKVIVNPEAKYNTNPSFDTTQKQNFFEDETDSSPTARKESEPTSGNKSKNKEMLSNKVKEYPITRKMNVKPKTDETKSKENIDKIDNDPDITHISNGTHLISIKNLHNDKRHKMQHLTRDEVDEPRTEERIVNQEPPKPKFKTNQPEETYSSNTNLEENTILPGIVLNDKINKDDKNSDRNTEGKRPHAKEENNAKDPNEITITNHNYEEFEERNTVPPTIKFKPTNTYSDGNQESCNYLHNPQNSYNNPYRQKTYGQYGQYYDAAEAEPKVKTQESNDPYAVSPDNIQPYYAQDNQPIYDPYKYEKQPSDNKNKQDIGNTYEYCPEFHPENNLDRIWRTWKDVEIKIRKSQGNNDPIDIDTRRNLLDKSNVNIEDLVSKLSPYAIQPIGLNGYYDNQNSALIHPYMRPSYRYRR